MRSPLEKYWEEKRVPHPEPPILSGVMAFFAIAFVLAFVSFLTFAVVRSF